ncbi:MAG: hypothetical protein LBS99_02990 [Clostridiales bacterium]|jgi:hypothetical protein|nr:hypothetical protein [Clostridiales bacterium]
MNTQEKQERVITFELRGGQTEDDFIDEYFAMLPADADELPPVKFVRIESDGQ